MGTAKSWPEPCSPPGPCSVDCLLRTPGQQRSWFCNLQVAEMEQRGRGWELGEVRWHWPPGLCAFWDRLPKLTDMLSLVCLSVFQGPPPGCPSLSVTQRAEEGPPWLLYLPGPASEPGLWRGRRREGGYLSLRNMLTPY